MECYGEVRRYRGGQHPYISTAHCDVYDFGMPRTQLEIKRKDHLEIGGVGVWLCEYHAREFGIVW